MPKCREDPVVISLLSISIYNLRSRLQPGNVAVLHTLFTMKLAATVLLITTARAGVVRNGQHGNFLANCDSIAVGPVASGMWHLNASCGPNKERVGVKLDDCIGNNDGVLEWQKG